MSTAELTPTPPQLHDGDEVLLYQDGDAGVEYRYNHEAFWRAACGDDTIIFRLLDDNGDDIANHPPRPITATYRHADIEATHHMAC